MMKAGLVFADKITTVSPTYAREILDPYYGRGMEGILNARKDDLYGIVNGIDTVEFDPETDKNLKCNYTPDDLAGKYVDKTELFGELDISIAPSAPLIGMVTRMTEQKGLCLLYTSWVRRMARSLTLYDVLRIDHFRGCLLYTSTGAYSKRVFRCDRNIDAHRGDGIVCAGCR